MRFLKQVLDITLYCVIGMAFAALCVGLVIPFAVYITYTNWKEAP